MSEAELWAYRRGQGEAEEQTEALTSAVRAIHLQRTMLDGYGMPSHYCADCRQQWPCATEMAVRSVVGEPKRPDDEEPF